MDMSVLYYILLGIGFCLVFIPPVTVLAQGQKLVPNDFMSQIFLPNTFGLLLLMGGFYGLFQDVYTEGPWQVLVGVTAAGGILMSLVAGFQSLVLIRWQAD